MRITLEVTQVTPDIYKAYDLKAINKQESVNRHIDVTLEGAYTDLKRFVLSEYSCGCTVEDTYFFWHNVED